MGDDRDDPERVASRLATVSAELASIGDAIDRYRHRVAELAGVVGADREDLTTAIYEAERSLIGAHRLVVRASKTAR